MDFEFDLKKSASNKIKHGIDFEEAQELWEDPHLLELEARSIDEPRFLLIGKIGSKYWSAVVTHRDNKVRIISVRRARREEVDLYEES